MCWAGFSFALRHLKSEHSFRHVSSLFGGVGEEGGKAVRYDYLCPPSAV